MMSDEFKYIVSRVLDNANDAISEAKENPEDDFTKAGKWLIMRY